MVMALICKIGRKGGLYTWKPVRDWNLIDTKRLPKGLKALGARLHGLYRVTMADGRKAYATRIEGVGE